MLPPVLSDHWQQLQRRFIDGLCQQGLDWPEFWQDLSAKQQHQAMTVLCLSDYVATVVQQDTEVLLEAIRSDDIVQPLTRVVIRGWLDEWSATAVTEDDWHTALRQLRRRAMVRIIWRDLLRIATTMETTRALSDLADECVSRSIEFLTPLLKQRYGQPLSQHSKTEQPFLVLGMGKLGACELNLSSDIDLIFAYPDKGDTSGPKVISNQEFFIKLGQKLIQALDKHTCDGFVFRTDMRLRPYGQSGPLVMNFQSLENYYQDQGRDWERYAMVKARVITGEDNAHARQLLKILRPFTYRQYLDFSAFESLRSMKAMITQEVRRRGLDNNIKLGPGGIREVEFIVQAFQLIRGGQDTQLQNRELLTILSILSADGYLPDTVCEELMQAYLFLRNSEHVIQAINDEQTQLLPDDELNRTRLAHAMNCDSWDDYYEQLQCHRSHVSHHFSHIVADDKNDEKEESNQWSDLWQGQLTDEEKEDFLNHYHCTDADRVQEHLQNFRESKAILNMQPVGRARLDTLMPLLLQELWSQDNPASILQRLVPLLTAVSRRTAYLVLLSENPQALKQLVTLYAASSWVSEYITQTPLLLDELLIPDNLYRLPDKDELAEELHLRLLRIDEGDLEQQMEQLRQFVRAHKLHAAACDIMQALPLTQISDYLTCIAEVVLTKTMWLAFQHMVEKYGYPTGDNKEAVTEPEFVVIGYGKVGGIELSYSSDLDLVFLHHAAANRYTTGERSQENGVFYTRMGQRMIHMLTTQTRSGICYDVDMRLRPSGKAGMIVTSVKAFQEYQKQHAWVWEQQALVRARAVCGSVAGMQGFNDIRQQILCQPRDISKLKHEVMNMREKMRDHLGSKKPDEFHLKYDRGGIVDIEFLVQFGVLSLSSQYPQLTSHSDNLRLLEEFAKVGWLEDRHAGRLKEAWLYYRQISHVRALENQSILFPVRAISHDIETFRSEVRRIWCLTLESI